MYSGVFSTDLFERRHLLGNWDREFEKKKQTNNKKKNQ